MLLKKKRFTIFFSVLMISVILPLSFLNNTSKSNDFNSSKDLSNLQSSQGLAIIYINDINDWDNIAAGSGTSNDPYVISGLNINANGFIYGILIENSNVYFVIEQCTISNAGGAAIRLQNVVNGHLMENNLSHNNGGIKVHAGENNQIIDNIVTFNEQYGLDLTNGLGNNIFDNTISHNNGWGMFIYESDQTTITRNVVNANAQVGILVESDSDTTDNNIITDNTVNYNGWNGIYLEKSRYSTISGNILEDNVHSGITLRWSDYNEVSENEIHYSPAGIALDSSNYNSIFFNNLLHNDLGISESSDCIGNIFDNNEYPAPIWRRDILPGDIILNRNKGLLTLAGLFWTHAGIYVGNDQVVEARSDLDGGISYYDITDWDYPQDTYVVLLRVTSASSEQRFAAAQWARKQAERSFFPLYSILWYEKKTESDSLWWYCSELVWASYKNQGIDIDFDESLFFVSPDDIYLDNDLEQISAHLEKFPEGSNGMKIIGESPIDLHIVDPDGLYFSNNIFEIPDAIYLEGDLDQNGEIEDIVLIEYRKEGEYLITVIPEQDALPTDIYTLEASANSIVSILANDVQIQNIPENPYIIESTEQEIEFNIPATIDFDPDTLNLKSPGTWVTVYIELPIGHGYDISELTIDSVMLNDEILAEFKPTNISDYDDDGIPDLMVKFSKKAIRDLLQIGENVIITITGELFDGRKFKGMDTIRVITQEVNIKSSNTLLIFSELLYTQPLTFSILLFAFIGIIAVINALKKIKEKQVYILK